MHVFAVAKICSSVWIQFGSWSVSLSFVQALSPGVWGDSASSSRRRSGSTALLFQLPRDISHVGCGPTDHFLADIVKTRSFKIYLFTRSSSSFTNLDCIDRECDGAALCTDPAPLILHDHGRFLLLLCPWRVGWGIAGEPTGITCGRR